MTTWPMTVTWIAFSILYLYPSTAFVQAFALATLGSCFGYTVHSVLV